MAKSDARLHYIDALRTFCMLFGIFVHSSTIIDGAIPNFFKYVSIHFRMATFFLISGYFAAMLIERYGAYKFIYGRLRTLLLPFVTTLVLLNPATVWLMHIHDGGTEGFWSYIASPPHNLNWQLHLWFLLTLAIFVTSAPITAAIGRTTLISEMFFANLATLPAVIVLFAGGTAAAVGEILGRGIYMLCLEWVTEGTFIDWPLQAGLRYYIWFAIGFWLYAQDAVFQKIHSISLSMLLAGIVLSVCAYNIHLPNQHLNTAADVFAEEFFTFGILSSLLYTFRRWFSAPNKFTASLNDAVYTIYLVHYFIVYIIAVLLLNSIYHDSVKFLLTASLTLILSWFVHRQIIAPSNILRLLFNGRWPP